MQQIEDLPLVLAATHVAKILNVSRSQAYEVMKLKDFPRISLTGGDKGNVRVLRDDLFKWLESRKVTA